jgi:hypothetical protein
MAPQKKMEYALFFEKRLDMGHSRGLKLKTSLKIKIRFH